MSDKQTDPSTLNFEAALKELETIVDRLERGDVELEESIKIYEHGEALRNRCSELLTSAEMKIEKIKASRDGKAEGTEPLDN